MAEHRGARIISVMFLDTGRVLGHDGDVSKNQPKEEIAVSTTREPEVVNLTPHPVIFRDADGREITRLAPSGRTARITETSRPDGTVQAGAVTVPVEVRSYGTIEGLPDPDGTTMYVVPLLAALAARAAARDTSDLLFPGEQTRDADGTVNGCRTLARLDGLPGPRPVSAFTPGGAARSCRCPCPVCGTGHGSAADEGCARRGCQCCEPACAGAGVFR